MNKVRKNVTTQEEEKRNSLLQASGLPFKYNHISRWKKSDSEKLWVNGESIKPGRGVYHWVFKS